MSTASPNPPAIDGVLPGPTAPAATPAATPVAAPAIFPESAPAGARARLLASGVTLLFTLMVFGAAVGIGWVGQGRDESFLSAAAAPLLVAAALWAVMLVGSVAGTAASPGQWVLGLCHVDEVTGEPAPRRALVKEVALVGLAAVTLVVGVLALLRPPTGNRDGGQNALDRWAGTRVVRRSDREGFSDGSGFLGSLLQTQPNERLVLPAAATVGNNQGLRLAAADALPPDTAPAPVASGSSVSEVEIVLDHGTRLLADRAWVLGRNPRPQPGHLDAQPFVVPDVDKTLSKSHLVLAPAPGGVLVTDLYSTNGVSLRLPDGSEQPVAAGRTTFAATGCTVVFGVRTLQVRAC